MISRKFSEISLSGTAGNRSMIAPARVAALLVVLFMVACAPVPRRPAVVGDETLQSLREGELARHPAWAFTGRLAISQGNDGGNARIEWRQNGQDFDIQLSAPITRQSWRLKQVGSEITLEGLTGGVRQGSDAEALLLEATGWRIPLASMAAWVRGVRAPGPADISFDGFGLPATLRQGGWAVEYRGWSERTPSLPTKLFVRQADASVKLVVERWDSP